MQRSLSIAVTLAMGVLASATSASACYRDCGCGTYGYRSDAVYGYYTPAPAYGYYYAPPTYSYHAAPPAYGYGYNYYAAPPSVGYYAYGYPRAYGYGYARWRW
jgi:hypothetical protein